MYWNIFLSALLKAHCSCLWPIYEADRHKVKIILLWLSHCDGLLYVLTIQRWWNVMAIITAPCYEYWPQRLVVHLIKYGYFRVSFLLVVVALTWLQLLWKEHKRKMQLKSKAVGIPSPHLASVTTTVVECRWENIILWIGCMQEMFFFSVYVRP